MKGNKKIKKAIFFLDRFLLVYLLLSAIYYLWVKVNFPDTIWLTDISAFQLRLILEGLGFPVKLVIDDAYPKIHVLYNTRAIVSIYEGCNGASLIIIFMTFLASFFKFSKQVITYAVFGMLIINMANQVRLVALFFVSIHQPQQFYFYHKYLFNGLLFLVVLGLWYIATKKLHANRY